MTNPTTVTLEGRLGETIPTLPIPEVYPALATRPEGLTRAEAAERLQHF
jgi:hypothetical protein